VFRFIWRRAWLFILLGLAIFFLPAHLMRVWLPVAGSLPTPTPSATPDLLADIYQQALQVAAQDPLAALPLLEDVAFSGHPSAESARALAQAIQTARLAGEEPYTFIATGQALGALGEWSLARDAFLRSVELAPDYPEAWAFLGQAQQQLGEDGLPAIRRALDLAPRSVAANLVAALYYQRQQDFSRAELHFFLAAAQDPENASLQIQWGQNFVLAGDAVGGRPHFERALELSPDDPQIWISLANYSLDSELFAQEIGLPAAQRYFIAFPDSAEAMLLMARVNTLLDEPDLARFYFERAVETDAANIDAHLYYGFFLMIEGDHGEARGHFNKVILLAPESPQAALAVHWIGQTSH
jgi:tetratricopeptide (TPR) repeat protein